MLPSVQVDTAGTSTQVIARHETCTISFTFDKAQHASPTIFYQEQLHARVHITNRWFFWTSSVRGQVIGHAMKFSESPARALKPAPRLGEHTAEVLQELAGYDDAQLQALEAAGAIPEQAAWEF
jgi:crotonobetainyl-CoA:carnitine CoA-transferase CaiB-like acyl-CoA transferase